MRVALADPELLGNALAGDSWSVWRIMLIAAMGEPLTDEERAIFTRFTGRAREPLQPIEEAAFVIGRRGGKDRAASVLATFIAGCCEHPSLVPGETGVLMLLAPDSAQAAITLDYIEAAFVQSPILKQLVHSRSSDTLTLANGISVEVRAASFRRLRGRTCIGVIATESAFWYSDESSSNSDADILNAVRPTLATTGGPLIMITSPYARRGEIWETYRRHYGANGDPIILVAQGASRDFNPTLSQRVVDRALEKDHAAASAEYLAQFRSDIESFIDREAIMACIEDGVRERPPRVGKYCYHAFTDPSGGSNDSMTCAIGHMEGDVIIVDVIREIAAPFDPESAANEFASLFRGYGLLQTTGDRYAAQWCAQAFEKRQIQYRQSDLPKSALYLNLLPHLTGKTIRLLDCPRAVNQIASLERRTARGGKDSIDHPPRGHDDIANAIAGLAYLAVDRFAVPPPMFGSYGRFGNSLAERISGMSPEQAIQLGFLSRERALRQGLIRQ
jgi:hypothetical protein